MSLEGENKRRVGSPVLKKGKYTDFGMGDGDSEHV